MRLTATLFFAIIFIPLVHAQVSYSFGPTLKLGFTNIPKKEGDKFDGGQDYTYPMLSGGAGFIHRLILMERWSVEVETSFLRNRWREGWESYVVNSTNGRLAATFKDEFRFDFYSMTIPIRLSHRIPFRKEKLNVGIGFVPSWYLSSTMISESSIKLLFPEERLIEEQRHYYSHEYDEYSEKLDFENTFMWRMTGRIGFEINENMEGGFEMEMPLSANRVFYYPPYIDLGPSSGEFREFNVLFQIIYWLKN